jgi:hypothetical protein
MIQNQPGGRLVVAHVPLRAMMTFAYRIPQGGSAGPGGPEAAPPIDPNGPSIFTAIQEQLGLKLEAIKGPVDVIVIDSVQKPSEN